MMKRLLWRVVARLSRRPIAAQDLWVSIVINTLPRVLRYNQAIAIDRVVVPTR